MENIITSFAVRRWLTQVEIGSRLKEAIEGDDQTRERLISELLDHCTLRDREEAREARDAMRLFCWMSLEQEKLGRARGEDIRKLVTPVFIRFCEGAQREMTPEDRKICRLVMACMYTPERDPLAMSLMR